MMTVTLTIELKTMCSHMTPCRCICPTSIVNAVRTSVPMASISCTVKFVNSFARCQHLFGIAARHQVTSIPIFCRILLPCPRFNFGHKLIFNLLVAMVASRRFHGSPFRILSKQKNTDGTRQKPGRTTQKHNASVVA